MLDRRGKAANRDARHRSLWPVVAEYVGTPAVNGREPVKIQYALPLAVAIGLGFGAVGLHARTSTPPVYLVVEIDEVTDATGFEALRQTADATAVEVQFEDGRYFAPTEKVTALDGSAPKFFALIAFDSMTRAKAFNDSMKDNTALRARVTSHLSSMAHPTGTNQCPLTQRWGMNIDIRPKKLSNPITAKMTAIVPAERSRSLFQLASRATLTFVPAT